MYDIYVNSIIVSFILYIGALYIESSKSIATSIR